MQDDKKELPNKNKLRDSGKVLPQEPVEIFATDSKSGAHLGEPGTKHVVHAVLAKKLIDKGAATAEYTAPKKKASATKLNKSEIDALTEELGHAPTDEEILAAIEEKEALK